MARRKQREPRKSAAYLPTVKIKAATFEDKQLQDNNDEYIFEEEEDAKGSQRFQDSPTSDGTNPDTGYLSPRSDSSDQIPDFTSVSSKEEGHEEEEVHGRSDNSVPDALAQTKAVCAGLISNASWSNVVMNIMESGSATSSTASTNTDGNYLINRPSNANRNIFNGKADSSSNGCTGNNCNVKASNGASEVYDWHQAAVAKTLQQTHHHLSLEPNLFSTVQLYRQNHKLYGSVLTGASKFKCKDCNAAYDTLVGLTVHMNDTGHYHDDNHEKEEENNGKHWLKPRKRSLLEMEGKEDAQKVLKCMFCGHSFESLQDLSVHMIKTKHYQKVPLKEPVTALATKLVPSAKKRLFHDSLIPPCSPKSITCSSRVASMVQMKGTINPFVTPNNRYGYQNGASYAWQFEERKAQILKCMECGSSHDTLQQLTAHMMVTGHFLKVTHTALKKGKQLVFDQNVEENIQSIPLPPTNTILKLQSVSPALSFGSEAKKETGEVSEIAERKIKEEMDEVSLDPILFNYLKEEDLEEAAKGGLDILKSLENTVSSAISKAQTGTPTWGGYSSIHAAYQLQGTAKPFVLPPVVQSVQTAINSNLQSLEPDPRSLIYTHSRQSHRNSVSTMDVSENILMKKEREERMEDAAAAKSTSPLLKENLVSVDTKANGYMCKVEPVEILVESQSKNVSLELGKSPIKNGHSLGMVYDHSTERPFISPLCSLQLVVNTHLPKASKLVSSSSDPLSVLYKISNRVIDKTGHYSSSDRRDEMLDTDKDTDQPIDLRKCKSITSSIASDSVNPQENALMDISKMVKSLSSQHTSMSSSPPCLLAKSDTEGSSFEDLTENFSFAQKQKGRQSNWNPQHLLILQAEFASSLRQTPEGRYIVTDLCPRERVKICKFTGLLMTTVSHWLANVKYQLRRTGGTKFLKNLDSRNPLFLCGECDSKFRTSSAYVKHLESHLGFSLKEMSKMSPR
ncbi:teashirt homolog 1-like isoform X2 [Clarias gariepinus]|uniref:teashirt homolog 1-like isoform X2 n=1 Tax=Clarias gariepinus TaxID=13013 RepID=UPI00234C11B6|nr:teashirt homolog 1-like isoform X2 [Clarias gariepinus]